MFERELEEAAALARGAGRIQLELYDGDISVAFKGQSDPVTEADTRSNAYIVDGLRKAFAADGIVAEELDDHSDALRRGRCWYVDPMDGTKEFLAKNGEFSVMIGLAVEGRALLGVVYQPVRDKLYLGIVGGIARLEQQGHATELRVSNRNTPSELQLISSRSHRSAHIERIAEELCITKETKSGSVGLKVGHIAEQNADLYVHFSNRSCAWDACAPDAILTAAGGRLTDLGGEPLRYGGPDMRNRRGLFACNEAAFEAVRGVVADLGREYGFL